ncbi:DUF4429 domain-containing protein [Actinoplanes sp. NPDC089786]|uniref:DUF4429 domain-containing protein n=1 Tax=Actinoplanes sp. NPDC089786 TaxID=3155185 RepID=UPI003434DF51
MNHLEARGQNGTVTFDGAEIILTRSRLLGTPFDQRIPVSAIADVELRPAGSLLSGFIKFRSAGGTPPTGADIVFSRRQEPQFAALRDAVAEAIGRRGAAAGAIGRRPAEEGSVADELTKLARLVELELLTRDEFDEQKAKLLRG